MIDTSAAHLAGAMGMPVWILLLHNSDWRWLLDRQNGPWYPTARLFRQQQFGNWAQVIDQVKSEFCSAADYDQGHREQVGLCGRASGDLPVRRSGIAEARRTDGEPERDRQP